MAYQNTKAAGALLILTEPAHKTILQCRKSIIEYIRTHLSDWHSFANDTLGLGLDDKDILFVSGFTKTSDWAEAAFRSSSFGGNLVVSGGSTTTGVDFEVSLLHCTDPSVFYHSGPLERSRVTQHSLNASGRRPIDQCIFLNYYKAKKRPFRTPTVIEAAAGPHELSQTREEPPTPDLQTIHGNTEASYLGLCTLTFRSHIGM